MRSIPKGTRCSCPVEGCDGLMRPVIVGEKSSHWVCISCGSVKIERKGKRPKLILKKIKDI